MKKMIMLLTLLSPAWAFAFENPCASGCTMDQIEAFNKANYKTTEQIIREAEETERLMYEEWLKEHNEAQARADALPKAKYVAKPPYWTCVAGTYEKATAILGDDAREHISVSIGETIDKCVFTVKQFYPDGKACDNLAALSGIAKFTPGVYGEEECRFEKEKWEATKGFADVIYTPAWTTAMDKKYRAALKPVTEKHVDRVRKLQEQEKAKEVTK
ncbi:hypothetical protein [Pseudomonas monteilii]|uniref:hypothetical protein n=1 Tax=Pseudomonas monteilii TaxID=76759 RepID=UPI001E514350|nr:hypothetical protein [Pseudomonas monteilii]MCE0930373.1 hypothetical protein [Pseudomonas monteilii]MCE0976082.1 hypothetical protein [Pseudomonas monteilii]MCE1040461.1 hypothetical protein [Pseudomonas monteilii]WJN87707.1 hypothetical protein LU680_26370 [Pseudomonas monteilii]WJO32561.1 hypothetical protein LU690_26440 [Pseudomonas monteilii]